MGKFGKNSGKIWEKFEKVIGNNYFKRGILTDYISLEIFPNIRLKHSTEIFD